MHGYHGYHEKGTAMTHAEHSSKAPHRTGPFALLRAFLHAQGTGAPKSKLTLLFFVVLATLAFSTAPAFATKKYAPAVPSSFGHEGRGTGNGELKEPHEVAVNEVTLGDLDDVYVIDADLGNYGVAYFSSAGVERGRFEAPPEGFGILRGIAVDNSTDALDASAGDVYVADRKEKVIDKFSSTGSYLGQLTETTGGSPLGAPESVAVDPSGDLWVEERETESSCSNNMVDEFTDTGTFVKAFKIGSEIGSECGEGIAVDSSGDVYVIETGRVVKFEGATGTKLAEFGTGAQAVAVDPSTENLVVEEHFDVALYGPSPGNSSTPIETFATGGSGVAVNGERIVYVSQSEKGTVEVFDYVLFPAVTVEAAPSVAQTTATLSGTVNPDEAEASSPSEAALTGCQFEYGTEAGSFTNTAACSPAAASIVGEQHVSAHLSGLQGGTVYHYRLSATNAANRTEYSQELELLTTGPRISEEWVSDIASTSATLGAQVNPREEPTTYYFQYSTAPTAGCTASPTSCTDVPAAPGVAIGSGDSDVQVSQQVQGLQSSTVYHYRVIATNGDGTVAGPDQTFTTQGSGGTLTLPDGRSWELVSPVQKLGAEVIPAANALIQASEDGDAISYTMSAPFVANPAGNVRVAQALSRRDGGGRGAGASSWSTEDIATPYTKPAGISETDGEYKLFSPGLSYALVEPFGENPLAPGGEEGSIYVRDDSTGAYTLLTESVGQWSEEMLERESGRESGSAGCQASTDPANGSATVGSGDDGCIVYFVSPAVLATGASSGAPNLYVAAGDSSGAWTASFIATLSAGSSVSEPATGDALDWEARNLYPGTKTVEVSPDGRYLAFMSDRSLTGYDNRDANSGEPDEEVYRFHYEPGAPAGGSLVCASCDPTGARPGGWLEPQGSISDIAQDSGGAWSGRWVAATIPGMTEVGAREGNTEGRGEDSFDKEAYYQPRNMLDSGRLFFDSHDALVPQDVNGVGDVYEYESGGVGSCATTNSGCVALLSAGTGPEESAFEDASASGDDVFFVTSDKLAPQDVGNEFDMYDAHVCSAEAPCPASVATPPPCTTADSCKPAQAPQPGVFGPSGSAAFNGPGDPPSPTPAVVKPAVKSLTNAQKLAKAVKACKQKPKKKRAFCEKQARKKYGASKAKKSTKGRK
jgi:hypothetical protein